jgi:hypothetical protein
MPLLGCFESRTVSLALPLSSLEASRAGTFPSGTGT